MMTARQIAMSRAYLLGKLPAILEEQGGLRSVESVFQKQGIPQHICEDRTYWVPVVDMVGLFEHAARDLGDPTISLRTADRTSLSDYGIWGRYVDQARSFPDFLDRVQQVMPLIQTHTSFGTDTVGDVTSTSLRWASPARFGRVHFGVRFVVPIWKMLRRFHGPSANVLSIELDSSDRFLRRDYEDYFGVGVGPWGRTFSGGCFDRGPGVLLLELVGTAVAERRV